jgi:hypothetical protein
LRARFRAHADHSDRRPTTLDIPRFDSDSAAARHADADLLKVFISTRESTCDECGEHLGRHAWITLVESATGAAGPTTRLAYCLSCADLDHLAFLPSGDAALTRRARKHSTLSAVVLKWSRARKQYERQGLLVEEAALERAEAECLADAQARERRREREVERREQQDDQFVARFAAEVRTAFPGCPAGREHEIARHACRKYSGRVGRSAAAKALDADAVRAAVTAHVRHAETEYDSLLACGTDRWEARERTRDRVAQVLADWRRGRE